MIAVSLTLKTVEAAFDRCPHTCPSELMICLLPRDRMAGHLILSADVWSWHRASADLEESADKQNLAQIVLRMHAV